MWRPRLRFSVRAMIVTVAIAALFTWWLVGFLRSTGWLRRPIELAPPPRWANTDYDLFDIVFSDLSENTESDNVGGVNGPRKARILVDARTYIVRTGFLKEALGDQIIKNVPAEIRADLVNRNSHRYGYSLERYQPSNPNIVVQDLNLRDFNIPYEVQYPGIVGHVTPTLPGYSHDGRAALVYFGCSLSNHADKGYYLLRKEKGRWEIILKGFYSTPHW
jgi:hypothetical protein